MYENNNTNIISESIIFDSNVNPNIFDSNINVISESINSSILLPSVVSKVLPEASA